jgi:hypothetical protein
MAKNYSLTPAERETVILLSDDSDIARVSTHQRRVITRLRNNPAAVEVEDISHGSTAGAIFEIPAAFVSFRSKRRQATPGSGDASKLQGAA